MLKDKKVIIGCLQAALEKYQQDTSKVPAGKEGVNRQERYIKILYNYQHAASANLSDICTFYQLEKATKWGREPRLISYLRSALYAIFEIKKPPLPIIHYPIGTLQYAKAANYAQISQSLHRKKTLEEQVARYLAGKVTSAMSVAFTSETELGNLYTR